MQVRILKPTKSAMQSGDGAGKWHIQFIRPGDARYREELMARTSSNDMMNEVSLEFASLEAAEEFAKTRNFEYEIIMPKQRKVPKKTYASNFV
jgi:hypothetical protein